MLVNENNQINTPNPTYNEKLTSYDLNVQKEKLTSMRLNDEQQIKQNMERNQINAVINNSSYSN